MLSCELIKYCIAIRIFTTRNIGLSMLSPVTKILLDAIDAEKTLLPLNKRWFFQKNVDT